MRINKYIADCGVCSRRAADELVKAGKVKVNNKTVTELGYQINEWNDTVLVDDNKIKLTVRYTYIMLNKPKGCVSTVKDDNGSRRKPEDDRRNVGYNENRGAGGETSAATVAPRKPRKTIMDYIPETEDKRLFPVGRLDYDSEGLIILTNDGELAYRITHPSNEVPKTYQLTVAGVVDENQLGLLRNGVELDDGTMTGKAKVKIIEANDTESRLEVTIFEGKNRQIRRMFAAVGKEVAFLKRVAIGDLRLGGLGRGMTKYLTDKEVEYLKKC